MYPHRDTHAYACLFTRRCTPYPTPPLTPSVNTRGHAAPPTPPMPAKSITVNGLNIYGESRVIYPPATLPPTNPVNVVKGSWRAQIDDTVSNARSKRDITD
jgi:hypothetical protein